MNKLLEFGEGVWSRYSKVYLFTIISEVVLITLSIPVFALTGINILVYGSVVICGISLVIWYYCLTHLPDQSLLAVPPK